MKSELSPNLKAWFKRIGWIGFIFFLFKGILWLVAGKLILDWIGSA